MAFKNLAIFKFWVIAYRDLGRNRRRTIFTLSAVALGLALLILVSGYIAGVIGGSVQNSIRLRTGHVQIRAESYDEARSSLLWADLVRDPDTILARASAMEQVEAAAPVLWAGTMLSTIDETVGLQLIGIDPESSVHDPIREGMVAGQFLASDERGGILIGRRLAEGMGIGVGQRVSLVVGQSEGQPVEGIFSVRGLFATGIPGYDEATVIMPLSQAQAFTGSGERASAIVIMLHQQEDAEAVASSLSGSGLVSLTWEEMHSVLLETVEAAMGFYYMMYGIVILVVAVIIMNTLLMAVFERTREMGILAALGMKSRQILLMVLFEAFTLALVGILVGIAMGTALVVYLGEVGIPIDESVGSVAGEVALGSTLYTSFVPGDIVGLSVAMLMVILLASLYPAWYAARLEPVRALHSL
jgi:ABC-type lipoprotein release transport system permease subunit